MADDTGGNANDILALRRKIDRYREKLTRASEHITERDTEIEALKKKLPGDDALVLTGDEKKRAEALFALGKTADEVAKVITDGEKAAAQLARIEKRDKVHGLAKEAGVNPDALWSLVERDDEGVEIAVQGEGDDRALTVTVGGEVKKPDEHWGALARALSPTEEPVRLDRKGLPPQRASGDAPREKVTKEEVRKDIARRVDTAF